MSVFEQFYDLNPVQVIDQNKWVEFRPAVRTELVTAFRGTGLFTPMISWQPWIGQAQETWESELIPADVSAEPIDLTTNFLPVTLPFDSRKRKYQVLRYGDKLQLHKSAQYFNQWNFGAGAVNDWRPLMRSVLNNNIVRKHELLSRNIFMRGPKNFWTYGGSATDLGSIGATDTFKPSIVNEWNLRVGNTGNPIVPGTSAKMVIVPPGVKYDLMLSIAAAATNETSLWHDIVVYQDKSLAFRNEIGEWKGLRFVEATNDEFGQNPCVLYNVGAISKQYGVTAPIGMGDGAPDPEVAADFVDNIWAMGQKNVTHYVQLEDFGASDFSLGEWVTIHIVRTSAYGVPGGVDPLDTTQVTRRIVKIDATNNRLSFDRPLFRNYSAGTYDAAGSVTGATPGTFYAFVTKGRHLAMNLVLGSRDAVSGRVYKPIQLYEPPSVDDFMSVYRVTWDEIIGYQMLNPHAFELHFCAVTLPKVGGLITP